MSGWPVRATCALVRLWTKVYTLGLPSVARDVRLAEIESDLWESTHDKARPLGAFHVMCRLLLGLADDLRWRAIRTSPNGIAAVALSMAAAAALVAWVYIALLGPQTLPQPHGRPMNFASDRPGLPPPPPPPPPPDRPR